MSVDTIFNRVIALMFGEKADKTEAVENFLIVLNIIVEECFDAENGLREAEGKELLPSPPFISALNETLDYNWRLMSIIPYGVAGTLYAEDDISIATIYKNKYEAERAACVRGFIRDVGDVYGECAE